MTSWEALGGVLISRVKYIAHHVLSSYPIPEPSDVERLPEVELGEGRGRSAPDNLPVVDLERPNAVLPRQPGLVPCVEGHGPVGSKTNPVSHLCSTPGPGEIANLHCSMTK